MVLCLRSPLILYSFCYGFFPTPETFIFFNNQDTLSPDGTGQFCSSLNFQMRRMSMGGAVDISRRSSCEAMGCEGYIHGRLPKRRSMARFLLETGESNKSFLPPKNSNWNVWKRCGASFGRMFSHNSFWRRFSRTWCLYFCCFCFEEILYALFFFRLEFCTSLKNRENRRIL